MKRVGRSIFGGVMLLALAFTTPSCKQDTDDLILASSSSGLTPAVYQSVSSRFPGATNVQGQHIDADRWLVTFNEGTTVRMSLLGNNGSFLNGEQNVPISVMPGTVNSSLSADLPGNAVRQVTVVQQNGLITGWRVNGTGPDAKSFTYLIDPTGSILQKS